MIVFVKFNPKIEGDNVNKQQLIDFVAKETDLPKTKAQEAVEAFVGGVTTALKSGEEVQLVGFGKFKVSDRAASKGRNPKTGEVIDIKAYKQPGFKAGKELKDAVNG